MTRETDEVFSVGKCYKGRDYDREGDLSGILNKFKQIMNQHEVPPDRKKNCSIYSELKSTCFGN